MKFRVVVGLILTLATTWAFGATWQLPAGYYVPAKMPMTVVFPRPDSETNTYARQRLAYADGATQYRIPISIQGGAYPFHFSLAVSPTPASQMKIGQNYGQVDYGIVTWTPQASDVGKTYNVSVTVTDQDGNTKNVTWSVTATTSHFVFVDPNAAAGGDGTKAHPLNSTTPLFVNHTSSTPSPYANDIVYFRSGTTNIVGPESNGNVQLQNNKNPMVWLGYPGDNPKPVLDFSHSKILVDAQNDVYMGGLHFYNARNDVANAHFVFFNQNTAQKRMTFFEDTFDTIHRGTSGTDNPAAVTFFNPGSLRQYLTIMGCTLTNYSAPLTDTYAIKYGVIENNTFEKGNSSTVSQGMLIKSDIQDFSIRRNSSLSQIFDYGVVDVMMQSQTFANNNIELCYNDFVSSNINKNAIIYNWAPSGAQGNNNNPKVYIYRNTLTGGAAGLDPFPYTVYEEKNVMITSNGTISTSGTNRIVVNTDNITGTPSDSIIDASGNLSGSYTQYTGTHGYKIPVNVNPLSAPSWN